MRNACLYAVLLVPLAAAIMGGCAVSPPAGKPVSDVAVARVNDPAVGDNGLAFTVTFDQDVTGFADAAGSLQLLYDGTSGGTVSVTQIDGRTFRVVVSGVTGQGTVTLVIPQGAAQDSLGNPTPASQSDPVPVDTVAPRIVEVASTTPDGAYAAGAVIDLSLRFSEPVTLAGGALSLALNSGRTVSLPPFAAADRASVAYTVQPGDNAASLDVTSVAVAAGGQAADAAGNALQLALPPGGLAGARRIAVDTVAPVVTVRALATNDATPALSGTINEPGASLAVTVAGKTHAAVNNADGTWTLPDNAIDPALAAGTYEVAVTATDPAGNVGTVTDPAGLVIDTVTPIVAVDTLTTNDTTPPLTGKVDDPAAAVTVTVAGTTYDAVNNTDGTWTLADGAITPALADGSYDVVAVATDAVGNVATSTALQALTVDTAAPAVTVNSVIGPDGSPAVDGTVSDPLGVTVKVTVAGTEYDAVVTGTTWSLAAGTIDPPLAAGTHDAAVRATDAAGNAATIPGTGAITVTAGPVVKAASLAPDNAYMLVTFDQPVYGDAGHSQPVVKGSFSPAYAAGDDPVTGVTIDGVAAADGGPLAGGETVIRVQLLLQNGPSEGLGFLGIRVADDAVYNGFGQPAAGAATADLRLRDEANLLSPYDWSFDTFAGSGDGLNWNAVNAAAAQSVFHTGAHSVRFSQPTDVWEDHSITVPDDSSGGPYVDIGPAGGTKFRVSAWVRIEQNNVLDLPTDTRLRLMLKMELAAGGSTVIDAAFEPTTYGTWTKIEFTGYAPADITGHAWATFQTRAVDLNDNDVYVDDLRLVLP